MAIDTMQASGTQVTLTMSQKDLAPPGMIEAIKALPKGNRDIETCGYVFGKVHSLSIRSNKFSDGPSVALVGLFEGVRCDGLRIRSTACYLPAQIHNQLVEAVRGEYKLPAEVAPKQGMRLPNVTGLNEINFCVELGLQHDDSEVGYRWVCRQHGEDAFAHSDPFAALREFAPAYCQLAGPSTPHAAPSASIKAALALTAPVAPKAIAKPGKSVATPSKRKGRAA